MISLLSTLERLHPEEPFMSASYFDQPRITRPSFPAALFLLSAGWLAAFPSHASVKGKWADDVSRDLSFSRVLVVGMSPDRNQRCRFERSMASKLRSADTVALVSCDAIPATTPLSRESIEAAVAAENADAVFTTSLISAEWEMHEGGTRDTQGLAEYRATDAFYGVYGTVVAVDFETTTPLTTLERKAEVTSKLYETRGATVVYTLETKIRDVKSTGEGLAVTTGPISKKLRKAGLVR
jgi:hypothetical protein